MTTFSLDQVLTSAVMNSIVTPDSVDLTQTSAQTIPTGGAATLVNLGTVQSWQGTQGITPSNSNASITIGQSGLYLVTAQLLLASPSAPTTLGLQLKLFGSTLLVQGDSIYTALGCTLSLCDVVALTAAQVIALYASSTTATAALVNPGTTGYNFLSAVRLSN